MEIKTFERAYLEDAKEALKSAFYREGSSSVFNEWEFAQILTGSDGYLPELCLIALDAEKVIGYNALTKAQIGGQNGLALGPLGVRKEEQNRGVGSALVEESVRRAKKAGFSWIALLGGDYYSRFGFESAKPYGVWVTDNAFDNDHIQILFLEETARDQLSGRLTYCSAFYDADGNLL